METTDNKIGFRQSYKELVANDEHLQELRNIYSVQNDKMSDVIEYVYDNYKEELTKLMNKYNIDFETMTEIIVEL